MTIAPDVVGMLEPLERFEALRRRAVRLGDGLNDLAYANPYAGAREAATGVLRDVLDDERSLGLQYSPFGGHTLVRRAVADALRASHHLDFAFGDVVMTPGAMAALQVALRCAGRPDGEVIVPVPCWIDHPLYVAATGLTPVIVPLSESSFDLDVDAVVHAVTERTCAVVLAHPANPTGRLYGLETLRRLAAGIAEASARHGTDVTLIADEAHRDFTGDETYHSSCEAFDRTLIVYSFGKYHFLQGQRTGYVAVSPRHPAREEVARELVRWTRISGIATPTALMQRAVPALLALTHDQAWLQAWRHRYVEALTGYGYEVVSPQATLFVYVRTPAGHDDWAFVERLAADSLLCLPAEIFHHQGYFRLSLTGSEAMLERAIPILRNAVGT